MSTTPAQLFTAFVTAAKNLNTQNKFNKTVEYTKADVTAPADREAELVKYFTAADKNGNNDGHIQASELSTALGVSDRVAQRWISEYIDDKNTFEVKIDDFVKEYADELDADSDGNIDASEKQGIIRNSVHWSVLWPSEQAQEFMTQSLDQRKAADIYFVDGESLEDGSGNYDGDYTDAEALADATAYFTEAAKMDSDDTALSAAELSRSTGLSAGAVKYLTEKYAAKGLDLTKVDDAAKVFVALDKQDGMDGSIGSDRKEWLEQKAADAGYGNTYAEATKKKTNGGGFLNDLLKPITDLFSGSGGSSSGGLKNILLLGALFFGAKALFKKQ